MTQRRIQPVLGCLLLLVFTPITYPVAHAQTLGAPGQWTRSARRNGETWVYHFTVTDGTNAPTHAGAASSGGGETRRIAEQGGDPGGSGAAVRALPAQPPADDGGGAGGSADIAVERAYTKTEPGGQGTEVAAPEVGQTVYFYADFRLTGTTGVYIISRRAVFDGETFCSTTATTGAGSYFAWCTNGWTATAGDHTLRWDFDYNNMLNESDENNNSATATWTSSAASVDLAAHRAFVKTMNGGMGDEVAVPGVGQTVFFYVDLTVSGPDSGVMVRRRALIDGDVFCDFTAILTPGNYFSWCIDGWTATAGSHTLRWDLDYNDEVAETDENNNSATKTWTTGTCTGDCTGECTSLSCDTTVNASIQTSSEVDCFTFTASDGEIVDISALGEGASSSFQPSWRLLDGSGSPVAACGSFAPAASNVPCGPLAASGSPYRLEVTASQPDDTGAYAVRLERLTAARACEDIPLTCAVPVVETIDDPLDTDLFSFSVDDGDVIEISVISGLHGGMVIDAAWQLIDGTGKSVDGLCGQFSASMLNFVCGPLPASGNPYRLKVGDDDAHDAGQYKVRFQPLTLTATCSSTALACGVALTTEIADPPPDQLCGFEACPVLETKLFNFSVNEGERIAVTVESVPPFGPHFSAGWRLLDRTGNPVEGGCGDFSSSQPNFECGPLAAVGSPYQLEVGGTSDPVAGNARVLVNFLTSTCATECPGDCDGSQDVVITDLLRLVNIALGNASVSDCGAGDADRDGMITIDEILTAVIKALNGCGGG